MGILHIFSDSPWFVRTNLIQWGLRVPTPASSVQPQTVSMFSKARDSPNLHLTRQHEHRSPTNPIQMPTSLLDEPLQTVISQTSSVLLSFTALLKTLITKEYLNGSPQCWNWTIFKTFLYANIPSFEIKLFYKYRSSFSQLAHQVFTRSFLPIF